MNRICFLPSAIASKFSSDRAINDRKMCRPQKSQIERLEERALFSVYVVNLPGDPSFVPAGHFSLRKAIELANTAGGTNVIKFSQKVFATPQTIDLQKPLNVKAGTLTILGPNQPLTLDQDIDFTDPTTLYVKANATLRVTRLNFTNDIETDGLAVVNNAGTLLMVNSTVSNSIHLCGIGGIYNTGLLKLGKVTISGHGDGNSDAAFGAGLQNDGQALLEGVTFSNDDAGSGGAIGQNAGSLTAINVTVTNCGADTNAVGGAITLNQGTAKFVDCTIDGSFMLAEGVPTGCSGIAIAAVASKVRLINDTITNSQLFPLGFGDTGDIPTCGAISVGDAATLRIGNTIVSGMNEVIGSPMVDGPEIVGTVISLGHNLIGQTSALTIGLIASDLQGTNASPLDPMLNPLANNGAYTETELPEPNSPLIDAGDNSLVPADITNDQRGAPRIAGSSVDIGSVETNSASASNSTSFSALPITLESLDDLTIEDGVVDG